MVMHTDEQIIEGGVLVKKFVLIVFLLGPAAITTVVQASVKSIDPDERDVLIRFVGSSKSIHPQTVVDATENTVDIKLRSQWLMKWVKQKGYSDAEIEAAIEAMYDQEAKKDILNLEEDPVLRSQFDFRPIGNFKLRRVGFDKSKSWAYAVGSYGGSFSGGNMNFLYHKEKGAWVLVDRNETHYN